MAKSRKSRATASQYKYPEREEFQKVLQRAGYSEKTAYALVTGIANPKGSTFVRARELWLEHMNGKPYPHTSPPLPQKAKEDDAPPPAVFMANEDVSSKDTTSPSEEKPTLGKMEKVWKQRQAGSSVLKQAAKAKSSIHVTLKVSQAIKDIVKMRECDGSTNDKLLALIEVLIS